MYLKCADMEDNMAFKAGHLKEAGNQFQGVDNDKYGEFMGKAMDQYAMAGRINQSAKCA